MKPQEIYVKVPVMGERIYIHYVTRFDRSDGVVWVTPLTALVFTPEEFEAEKLKIASEAWDAGYDRSYYMRPANIGGKMKAPPSKEAFIQSLKT